MRRWIVGAVVLCAAGTGCAAPDTATPQASVSPTPSLDRSPPPTDDEPTYTLCPAVGAPTKVSMLAGVDRGGKLAVVAAEDASVERTLVDYGPRTSITPDDPIGPTAVYAVAVAGGVAYWEEGPEPAAGTILCVPLSGGTRRIVAHGRYPEVSPDGRWLAIAGYESVIVVDLATGRSRNVDPGPPEFGGNSRSLSWAPDSRLVAIGVGYPNLTESEPTAWILDTAVNESAPLRQIGAGKPWTLPTYTANALLVVDGRSLVELDPVTFAERRRSQLPGVAESLDVDAEGRLLLITADLVLWRSDDGTRFTRIAEGVAAVDG